MTGPENAPSPLEGGPTRQKQVERVWRSGRQFLLVYFAFAVLLAGWYAFSCWSAEEHERTRKVLGSVFLSAGIVLMFAGSQMRVAWMALGHLREEVQALRREVEILRKGKGGSA